MVPAMAGTRPREAGIGSLAGAAWFRKRRTSFRKEYSPCMPLSHAASSLGLRCRQCHAGRTDHCHETGAGTLSCNGPRARSAHRWSGSDCFNLRNAPKLAALAQGPARRRGKVRQPPIGSTIGSGTHVVRVRCAVKDFSPNVTANPPPDGDVGPTTVLGIESRRPSSWDRFL